MFLSWNLQEMKLDMSNLSGFWGKILRLYFETSFINCKKNYCQPYLKIPPDLKFSRQGRVLRTTFAI